MKTKGAIKFVVWTAVALALCGPCHSGQKGKGTLTHAQVAKIEAGSAYVNVHTQKNPGGEIRGQVKVTNG